MHARRGLWQGLLIIWCAACIIGPIIKAEGLRRTFFPLLATTAKVRPADDAAEGCSRCKCAPARSPNPGLLAQVRRSPGQWQRAAAVLPKA